MKVPGQTLLKVAGIFMIIGAVISIIIAILGVVGGAAVTTLSATTADADTAAAAAGIGVIAIIICIVTLIAGVFQLVAGILGVKKSGVPNSAKPCLILGIVIIVLNVLSTIVNVASGGSFSIVSFASGLIIPVIYTVGAYQNTNAQG